MFLPILLFLCEKGGYIFSRRGWHEMIYMELCVLCALCVELGKNLCFFHAEVADYAEIFGTVFVVALLGYVLRSLRSLREKGVLRCRYVGRLHEDVLGLSFYQYGGIG